MSVKNIITKDDALSNTWIYKDANRFVNECLHNKKWYTVAIIRQDLENYIRQNSDYV